MFNLIIISISSLDGNIFGSLDGFIIGIRSFIRDLFNSGFSFDGLSHGLLGNILGGELLRSDHGGVVNIRVIQGGLAESRDLVNNNGVGGGFAVAAPEAPITTVPSK